MGFNPNATGNITLAGEIVGPVSATSIPAASITSAKIATGAITSTQLATGAVTATDIATGAISSTQLAAGAVTAAAIATGTVTTTQIAAATQATLRDRATHTGTQAISTIATLQTSLDGLAPLNHIHTTSDVTGLDSILSSKANNTYFVPIVVRAFGSTTVPSGFPVGGIVFTRQS